MNTTGALEPPGPPRNGPELLAEDHWTEKASDVTRLCEEVVAAHPVALRSVAHYTHGALDFVVRPLGSEPLGSGQGAWTEPRAAEGWPGRHLVVCTEDLNRSLQRLGTGELMRVVVGTGTGGMYCARIRGGQYLTGATLSGGTVVEMDECLNEAVLRIRTAVHHLSDEHLGGERGPAPAEPAAGGTQEFDVALAARGTDTEKQLRQAWQTHVNPIDLQYAAYYRDWAMVCAGDAFDDPRLRVRLMNIPVRARRSMYRDLAARLRADITRLRHTLRPVTTDPIDRLVLDVQEGAIHIHWLGHGTGTFLLGVTTDQHEVAHAEHRLRSLVTPVSAARLLP